MAMPRIKQSNTEIDKTEYNFISERISELEIYYKSLTKDVEGLGKILTNKVKQKKFTQKKLNTLNDNYQNMKNGDTLVVSLQEFRNVKNSIDAVNVLFHEIEIAIETSTTNLISATRTLKVCKKDLERCKKELNKFGVIHEFDRSRTSGKT